MSIKIKNLSKRYPETIVFNNLNLEIKHKQITCIMGPSGIGKTSLLNILLGIEEPDSGSIQGLEGKKAVAVFQEDRLVESLDSISNIELVCKKALSKDDLLKEFKDIGLEGTEKKPVSELSGGMKRRVAIIRAVYVESDIIIMDEPFKGLDLDLKNKVIEYVKERTNGKTVIIVTHDMDEVLKLEAEHFELNFTNKNPNDIMVNNK